MTETQKTITKWAIETFGRASNGMIIATRMNKEVSELLEELAKVQDAEGFLTNRNKILSECADVYVVLVQLADRLGGDLHFEVNKKMGINRERKWATDGKGTGQHI